MEKDKKTKLIFSIVSIISLLIVVVGIAYAYWILSQKNQNLVNTSCVNFDFSGENDITINNVFPLSEEGLDRFLSHATPYHFTITNNCDKLSNITINLESLNINGKKLDDEWVKAILYETDYKNNLFENYSLNNNVLNDENKVLKDSLHAYNLYSFTLREKETRDFNLLLYVDENTPVENESATWKGKITVSSEYKEDPFVNVGTLRTISSSYNNGKYDDNGMWHYKDILTKVVIENTKSVKTAPNGGTVYGPFDESRDSNKSVESYVVCEADDTNCIGYLQGDNGINANLNSSYLFYNFVNITEIEGLENLHTNKVTNMSYMFQNCKKLLNIDIKLLDTYNVTNMNSMFSGCSSITELDFSTFDTRNVTNMSSMFANMTSLQSLDLSTFDTRKVTSMNSMFYNDENMQNLNLENFNTSKVTNMSSIFNRCRKLTTLDLHSFDTSQVTNMYGMFAALDNLQELDLSSFNTIKVTDMNNMFCGAAVKKLIFGPNFNTSKVTNMSYMFYDMKNLQELDLSNFNTNAVTNMDYMFAYTYKLNSITFGTNFVHKTGATTAKMFYGSTVQNRPTGSSWSGVSFS